MPNAYEFGYGEVTFAEPDGTPIFSTTADLGLWTSVDEEPSPDPKWVRVSVPGADGAVVLSRALAGQVTYEQREVKLRFEGQRDTHAEALALVHRMRRALHGARVRMTTMLSAQIGGWYVADCECDGTADADGGVTIDVTAVADPFIRVGNQTLALPSTGAAWASAGPYAETNGSDLTLVRTSVRRYERDPSEGGGTPVNRQPAGVEGGTLWCAMNGNLFDLAQWPLATDRPDSPGDWMTARPMPGRLTLWRKPASPYLDKTVEIRASDLAGDWPYYPFGFPGCNILASDHDTSASAEGVAVDFYIALTTGVGTHNFSLNLVFDGTGIGDDGLVQSDAVVSGSWSHTAETAGASVPLVRRVTLDTEAAHQANPDAQVLSAIRISTYMPAGAHATICICMRPSGSQPTDGFVTPDVRQVAWTAGGPFGRSWTGADEYATDRASITPVSTHVRRYVGQTAMPDVSEPLDAPVDAYGTSDGMPPDGTAYVMSTLAATGGPYPTNVAVASYPRGTVTGESLTMRATPTLTSGDGGEVTIDGRTVQAPGGTVELGALTIPGGEFEVAYQPYGGEGMTLTWEGGAL